MSLKCILQGQDSKNLATKIELNQHIENKSNPHEVTAQQVGAVKFTSRYEASTEEEIDNALETIISAGLPGDTLFGEIVISANNLSLLGGGWGVRLHRGNDEYADVIATLMSDDVIRIKTRVKYQGAWMPWRELANDYSIVNALREKAPDGYGLGASNGRPIPPTVEGGLNTATQNGWYYFGGEGGIQNCPPLIASSDYGYLLVSSRNEQEKLQVFMSEVNNYIAVRKLEAGVWQPWEYVNPPMKSGVEYRTTERFWERPVYYKIVDCGQIADNKQVEHGIANMRDCIFCQGLRGAMPMPSISNNDLSDPWSYYVADVNRTKITLACGTAAAGGNCHVILKYTKTTD